MGVVRTLTLVKTVDFTVTVALQQYVYTTKYSQNNNRQICVSLMCVGLMQ